jgi:hypothetical protein
MYLLLSKNISEIHIFNFGYLSSGSRSQWPRGLRRGSAAARLLELWVWIPPEAWFSVPCDCCILSGIGRCVGLITRPEESYRVWCVWVWLRGPVKGGSDPESGRSVTKNVYIYLFSVYLRVLSYINLGMKWRVIWRIVNQGCLEGSCSFPNNFLLSSKIHISKANPLKHRMNVVLYYSQMLHFAYAASVHVTCESQNRRLVFP